MRIGPPQNANLAPRVLLAKRPDLLGDWQRAVLGSNLAAVADEAADELLDEEPPAPGTWVAGADARIEQSVRAHRARVEGLPDPFLPLALGDRQARAKERVIWENARVMVIEDVFVSRPKVLVVPKTPASFPTDLGRAALDEIAQVCAEAADVLAKIYSSPPFSVWINPPNFLSVKQLHVHIAAPRGFAWSQDKAQRERQTNRVFGLLGGELALRLAPL